MADNRDLAALTGNVAADEVTYSGDTAVVQLLRPVYVTGAEGSKTVVELVKLEDSAHTSGDPGFVLMAVRQDTPGNLSGTDGDYEPLQVSGGLLQTKVGAALPAGTNNIGDVDVLSLPAELSGPGTPTIDSYSSAAINVAAGATDAVLIAAPGLNKQIWVYGIHYICNVAGTVSIQDEDDTAITGVMPHGANGGMVVAPSGNFAMPLWKLGTNKALEMDTVTCEVDGNVQYAVVSV